MMHLLHTLYITELGAALHLSGQALCVTHGDGHTDRIPLHLLENIVCFSRGEATPQLLSACAQRGIGVCFLAPSGYLRYRVLGPIAGNVLLRKRQYLLSEAEDERLSLATEMVRGKIENEAWLLARFRRNHPEAASIEREQAEQALLSAAGSLSDRRTDDQLRGIEGNAAKAYFCVFDTLLLTGDDSLRFHGRSRRPPKDPCNALLSFAYAVLTTDCIQALTCAGLDPYVGFLHGDRPGKPSLALDLMEELRPLLADRLVLRLINLHMVSAAMFEPSENDGIYLNKEGRSIFLREWNRMKQKEVWLPPVSQKGPQGLLPHLQAQQLARCLRGEAVSYRPVQGR